MALRSRAEEESNKCLEPEFFRRFSDYKQRPIFGLTAAIQPYVREALYRRDAREAIVASEYNHLSDILKYCPV